jgi:hypothetical protein
MAERLLALLFTTLLKTTTGDSLEGRCTRLPIFEAGRVTGSVCAEAPPQGLTVLALEDEWTPRLLSETPPLPQPYRAVFVALANERYEAALSKTAPQDRFFELFGVFPSLSVMRGRLLDEVRHACHARIDGRALAVTSELPTPHAIEVVQGHLACEGLLAEAASPGRLDAVTRAGLAAYQRRHMIPGIPRLDATIRATVLTDSRELDFRALLRVLRERVVDATGLLEDGSAGHAWGTVLGRHIDAPAYRMPLRPAPLANAAPDRIAAATEAAAHALGWTSPAAAAFALTRPPPARVAVRLPPVPPYHSPTMSLRVEIDRGDVWRSPPFDETGQPLPSRVRRRPTLVLYAKTPAEEVALVRWPTTIGGYKRSQQPDGSLAIKYKPSPSGRRYWRDLLAAPAWFPPPGIPDAALVRRSARGWVVNADAVGPGYRSALGLMALLHHRAAGDRRDSIASSDLTDDLQIRTHGSGNYRSVFAGTSHGCHRLFNHLAIRLGSFLVAHRAHVRHGPVAQAYEREILWMGRRLVLRAETRGYHYELVPPIPVDVLPGRRLGGQ